MIENFSKITKGSEGINSYFHYELIKRLMTVENQFTSSFTRYINAVAHFLTSVNLKNPSEIVKRAKN